MTADTKAFEDIPADAVALNGNDAPLRTPAELAQIVERAAASGDWIKRVRLNTERRWYERIYAGPDHDLWLISWLPGQSTGLHDHGASSGAFIVAMGSLEELRPQGGTFRIERSQFRHFGPEYTHDVRNNSDAPAISIHAYSPPLTVMNEYELEGGEVISRSRIQWEVSRVEQKSSPQDAEDLADDSRIEQRLKAARARLTRVSPVEARDAVERREAVLVDIRPASQRASEGVIPGALIIERNVLEWRLDPSSSARLPGARSLDLQIIVFCSQGYASSLAAADLQDIGLWRATDMVGGFQAWWQRGLPSV